MGETSGAGASGRREEPPAQGRLRFWDWAKEYSSGITALAALSVPFLTALGGWYVASGVSDREVQAQHLDIAVAILSDANLQEQSTDDARALRRYGVDLLEHSSPVALPKNVRDSLIEGTLNLPETRQLFKELARETAKSSKELQEQSGDSSP